MSNPGGNIEPHVAASFSAQGLMRNFGARMIEGAGGRCVIEVDARDDLTQQNGYFHGGLTAAIADAACGHAVMSLRPADHNVLSVEFKMNMIAPADGDRLRAIAGVHKAGRTLGVVGARVEARRDGEWRHCAEMLATMMLVPPRKFVA